MLGILLAGTVSAQRLPDRDIPPPPPTGLSDESGIFGGNPEAQRQLIRTLQDLQRDYGFRMIVVLKRALISTTASDLACQLQQEWLPDGGGLVLVYESDNRGLGFGRDLSPGEGMENNAGIPAFALVAIISDALQSVETTQSSDRYVESLVMKIGSGITSYFKRREATPNKGRSLRLALVTVGALSLLALCGMGIGWLLGKADKKKSETRVFPVVELPERLGASYGGGGGATAFFGNREKN